MLYAYGHKLLQANSPADSGEQDLTYSDGPSGHVVSTNVRCGRVVRPPALLDTGGPGPKHHTALQDGSTDVTVS